jgi:hypothetical protein
MSRAAQIRALFKEGATYSQINRRLGDVTKDEYEAAVRILRIVIGMSVRAKRAAAIVDRDELQEAGIEPIDVMFTKPLRAGRRRSREEEDA